MTLINLATEALASTAENLRKKVMDRWRKKIIVKLLGRFDECELEFRKDQCVPSTYTHR